MQRMTSRQRVLVALDHREPDRVPFDCTFGYVAYKRLEQHLGFQPQRQVLPGNVSLSVRPPIEFLQELKVDLYYVSLNHAPGAPAFQYGMERYVDEWGVEYRRVETPVGLQYELAAHPLAEASLEDLDDYPWPDPHEPALTAGLEERLRDLYENTEFALVGRFSNSIFEQAFALRGLERLLMDMALEPDFASALMDRLTNLAIGYIENALRACGKYLHILRLAGDDMGHQQGTLLSPAMFRRLVKPRFARLYRAAKELFLRYNPQGKLMAHTDGDVYPLIPDYIEMGLDVLNPVQPYVAEMDHARLKRQFGQQLSFHGGIDLQRVLPFGSPEEVYQEAVKTMHALGSGGGYILAPTHYLTPDVPPENVLALRDAVLERGVYPLS